MIRSHVLICGGTGCTSSGSIKIHAAMERELAAQGLSDEIKIVQTGCFGLCANGPIMIVYPEGTFYSHVKVEDVPEIVSEHLLKGRIVDRLVHHEDTDEGAKQAVPLSETKFYKKQHRVALRNCGVINPENIDEYIGTDGYQALGKALTEMTPQQVIDVIKASGLRGRRGGGFPTGVKWQFAADQPKGKKYVV
ncbi:MAG: NAD(P)H-dependent oxidoreductase subunit E, partial [Clostridia bacterium]|nr:NAD(P)H-dependent oxidoreductase subunit E [Clostridia bacterium]